GGARGRARVGVGDGDPIAAQVGAAGAEDALVEHLEPRLRPLLRALERGRLRLVAAPLVTVEDLRGYQAVDEVDAQLGVGPVHALVPPGALLQVGRVGRRAGLL